MTSLLIDGDHKTVFTSVVGIGTDICECSRIQAMMDKHPNTFLERVYTPSEIQYCQTRRTSAIHFAGRWAAKEAILKAIGTGWAKGIHWTDLEICHEPGGQPVVHLHGTAAKVCLDRGIREILISISHTAEHAIAFAVAKGV